MADFPLGKRNQLEIVREKEMKVQETVISRMVERKLLIRIKLSANQQFQHRSDEAVSIL